MTTPPDHAGEEYPTLRGTVPPLREWFRIYVIGLAMGTADAVPGVSGGTIALIAGIYERLIGAITAITPTRLVEFLRVVAPGDDGSSDARAVEILEAVDVWFLIALLAGIITAVVGVTGVISWADDAYPVLLFGFFFGLIGASAVVLGRELSLRSADEIVAAVAGFTLACVVSGRAALLDGGGLPLVFVAGAIAVSAMILPGISGSLLLVILGQYTYLSDTLHAFIDELVAAARGGSFSPVVDHGMVVVAFVLGGLVGIVTVARVVRRALEVNRWATLSFLVALVVGALRAPVVKVSARPGLTWTNGVVLAFAVAAIIGALAVFLVDWYAVDIDLDGA